MSPLLSVILCTHNPRADFLGRTLDSLRSQTLPLDRWEFLLIDNGSKVPVAAPNTLGWHPRGRVVREETLGLTPARLRGIKESTSQLLVFVDDDNILAPDYLQKTLDLAQANPHLGCWGASVAGEFETQPAVWAQPYLCYLAIREVKRFIWSNEYRFDIVPVGAGLCIRKEIADHYAESVQNNAIRLQLDRKGNALTSGGDSDLAFTAIDLGFGIGLSPELKLTHLMPAGRIRPDYLERLREAIAYSSLIILKLHGVAVPGPARESLLIRWIKAYQQWRQPAEVRRIEAAKKRGEAKALRELALASDQVPPAA